MAKLVVTKSFVDQLKKRIVTESAGQISIGAADGGRIQLVQITGSESVSPNRWKYTVNVVMAGDETEVQTVAHGESGATPTFDAYNTYEFGNDENNVNGLSVTYGGNPEVDCGRLKGVIPIADGTTVVAINVQSAELGPFFAFSLPNQWDLLPGIEFRDDGEVTANPTTVLNILNEQANSRKDFSIEAVETEKCGEEQQINIEWNGIDVIGYGGSALTGIRVLNIEGCGDPNGNVLKATGSATETDDTANISLVVPQHIGGDDWIAVENNGECSSPSITHEGPGEVDDEVSFSYVTSVTCNGDGSLSYESQTMTLQFDEKGHFIGFNVGS